MKRLVCVSLFFVTVLSGCVFERSDYSKNKYLQDFMAKKSVSRQALLAYLQKTGVIFNQQGQSAIFLFPKENVFRLGTSRWKKEKQVLRQAELIKAFIRTYDVKEILVDSYALQGVSSGVAYDQAARFASLMKSSNIPMISVRGHVMQEQPSLQAAQSGYVRMVVIIDRLR